MAQRQIACPNQGCGATDTQQRHATSDELNKAGAMGDWIFSARMCSMCRCVYEAEGKTIHGFLDNAAGKGWTPVGETHVARSR